MTAVAEHGSWVKELGAEDVPAGWDPEGWNNWLQRIAAATPSKESVAAAEAAAEKAAAEKMAAKQAAAYAAKMAAAEALAREQEKEKELVVYYEPIDAAALELELRRTRTDEERLHRAQVLMVNALMKRKVESDWRHFVRRQRDEAAEQGVRLAVRLVELSNRREDSDCFFAVQATAAAVQSDVAAAAPNEQGQCALFLIARASDVISVQKVPWRITMSGTPFGRGEYAVLLRSVYEAQRVLPSALRPKTTQRSVAALQSSAHSAGLAAAAGGPSLITPLMSSTSRSAPSGAAPPAKPRATPFEELRVRGAAAFSPEDRGLDLEIDEALGVFVDGRAREVDWGSIRPPVPCGARLSARVHSVELSGLKGHVTYMNAQGKVLGKVMRSDPSRTLAHSQHLCPTCTRR